MCPFITQLNSHMTGSFLLIPIITIMRGVLKGLPCNYISRSREGLGVQSNPSFVRLKQVFSKYKR